MVKNTTSESSTTKSVSNIVKKIDAASPLKDSVYEEATCYFSQLPEMEKRLEKLHLGLKTAQKNLFANNKPENIKSLKYRVELNLKKIKSFESKRDEERLARLNKLKNICDEILSLCIGKNKDDTNKKTAKLLGTLALKMPEEEKLALRYNKASQHLYQAALSLKLLDQLLDDNQIDNEYILERAFLDKRGEVLYFKLEVQIPILMVSILHNVGMCHPIAQQILNGTSGDAEEFRVLIRDERIALLKCNYQQTLKYLTEGLGLDKYIGNSKDDRETFNKKEEEKFSFMRLLLKNVINPKQGIGNIIKAPQIYTSVVLPTKRNFTYHSFPRAFQVLNKSVERGSIDKQVVESLLKITGIFPQGYGITYVPKNSDGYNLERYELAIVNTLYPQEPYTPTCRIATRYQLFISSGMDLRITSGNNLYFPDARKKMMKTSPERLREILSKLWSNFEARWEQIDLLPKCWHPSEYFSLAKRQNIWNKIQ